MHEEIEKLIVLQERDRSIARAKEEVAGLEHERAEVNGRSDNAEEANAKAEQKSKDLEVRKNALETEIKGEEEKIRTYSRQQLETKDNQEYKALGRQQETCKESISNLETDEINILEEMDVNEKVLKATKAELEEANAAKAKALAEIDVRETNLGKKLEDLARQRVEAEASIDQTTLSRYNRLVERKGTNIVVGIQHGACGGCHMKLPEAEVIEIKSAAKVKYCPNCSRIVYYTRDMVLEAD
tara:strand:- start:229 stop:954 length:726 start_codon:yes stop_codon:yes gene_type:complete